MRIYGECGSEKPWRPPRRDLFYLLAMIAMQIAATLPSTQGGCPAIHQRCYCATDRGNINLICHNVGIIPQVPQFQPSNTTYHMLRIYWRTTMPTVQAGAFKGLKVKEVNLGGLEITTIQPGAFSDLGDILEELYLNNNHLQTIPDDGFKGLQQLTHLSLQYNRLNTVNPALFRDMSQLYSLRLSYNQLDSIPDDTFTSFKHSLAYLYLNYNRLTTLSRALFENLTRLKDLRLNNNQLDAIPDDTFNGHLQSLTGITLDSNRLISVNPALFSHLLQLRVVFLDDNRLLCDCQLAWMRTAKIFVDNPVCFNPPPVHGTSLMSYNISMCDPITTAKTAQPTTESQMEEESTTGRSVYSTTEISVASRDAITANVIGSAKSTIEHVALIAVGILSGLLAVALVISLLIHARRQHCVKCWTVDTVDDLYTHNRTEQRDMTTPVYDSITVPEETATYENTRDHPCV